MSTANELPGPLFPRVEERRSPSGLPMTAQAPLRLTRRERQIVDLLLEGCANKEIATRLGVSDQTVKNQLSALYLKAGVSSRLELVLLAQRGAFA
jgi:DNA-binding NarL/FixJ family response regulator